MPNPRSTTAFDKIVGKYIREARINGSKSQEAIGFAAGVTFQQVQKYERGENRLTLERFVKICRGLGLNPKDALSEILDLSYEGKNNA